MFVVVSMFCCLTKCYFYVDVDIKRKKKENKNKKYVNGVLINNFKLNSLQK